MSNIEENLEKIQSAVWGKDVRQAIHDSIHDCYEDGKTGSTDLIAREGVTNLTNIKADRSELAETGGTLSTEIAVERARISNVIDSMNGEYGESELWTGSAYYKGQTITLSDDASNYEYLDFYCFERGNSFVQTISPSENYAVVRSYNIPNSGSEGTVVSSIQMDEISLSISGTTITLSDAVKWNWNGVNTADAYKRPVVETDTENVLFIQKIVGRKILENTEVTDIRVGANGETYSTAGEAVRGQVSALKEDLGQTEKQYIPVELTYTNGYKFNNRNVGQQMGYGQNSAWGYTSIEVNAGEKYKVDTYTGNNDTYLVYYLDSEQLIVSRYYHASELVAGVQEFDIVIPTGASYLYVQCNSNSANISNYLKIANVDTISVSDSITNLKTKFYAAEYVEYDINRAFTEFNRYVKADGTCANSSGSVAYRRIDVSDCDTVKINNMLLAGSRAFVGVDANGNVSAILTNQGSALVSGTYDVTAFDYISFTGQSGTIPEVWKYNPKESDKGIIHGEEYDFGFNLMDYEIKGTKAVSVTAQNGSTFEEKRITYGDKDKSIAIRGYTVASGKDPQAFINIIPINAYGIQSFVIPVYTEDASNITLLYFGIFKDNETAPTWYRQVTALKNGWNYLRFDSIDYPTGIETWNNINGYRILMRATADSTVYVGDIITVRPNKAKLIFICDHGYKNFADVALPEFASRGFPVTFTMKLSLLGQSVEYASRILTESEVDELAQDPMVDINIHSALSIPSKDQTAEQTKEDAWKGLYFLKKHGCYVFPYRCAWWNNNAPHANDLEDILVMSATYTQADTKITAFPFANPHNVPRYLMHSLPNARVDTIFEQLKKTHGTILMYTHDISDTTPPEGTANINMSTAELTYLLSKIDTAVSEGWLEGATIRGLYTKYSMI